MGFLDGLGKFIAGKPVFDETNAPTGHQPSNSTSTPVDASGQKVIPRIEVTDVKTSHHDGHMITELWIDNASNEMVRIDTITMLGQKVTHNNHIEPGKSEQFVVYKGNAPTNDYNDEARITFRLERANDYFENKYFVKLGIESEGIYIIDDVRQDGPTRDI